jgi:Dolichyl-phosphate-mannose-protein mannosyltransferase
VTVLIALCVAELGGGRCAQALAAGGFVASPYGLGLGMLLHPTSFDTLTEAGFAYLALRILARPEPRLWPALGIVAGIGFETKGTMIVLIATFGTGTVLWARGQLRDRRALLALGLALALAAPQIGWEIARGWPTIAFLPSQTAVTAQATPVTAYVLQQILLLAGSVVLVFAGVRALWRRRLRALALLAPAVSLVFLLERGRSYYALPAMVVALAAGGVAVEAWWPTAGRRAHRAVLALVATLQLTGLGLGAAVVWPVLPTRTMINLGVWKPSFYDDELGWPALVADTAHAWDRLGAERRARTVILAHNYGEAGALDLWGPRWGYQPRSADTSPFSTGTPARCDNGCSSPSGMTGQSLIASAPRSGSWDASPIPGTSTTKSSISPSPPASCPNRSVKSGHAGSPLTDSDPNRPTRPRAHVSIPTPPERATPRHWPTCHICGGRGATCVCWGYRRDITSDRIGLTAHPTRPNSRSSFATTIGSSCVSRTVWSPSWPYLLWVACWFLIVLITAVASLERREL